MEPVPPHQTGKVVHYILHRAVIPEQAKTTKMRIVYGCSPRANTQTPSLNDCLETTTTAAPIWHSSLEPDAETLCHRRHSESISPNSGTQTKQRRTAGPMVRQPNGQKQSRVPFHVSDIWSHVEPVHLWGDCRSSSRLWQRVQGGSASAFRRHLRWWHSGGEAMWKKARLHLKKRLPI